MLTVSKPMTVAKASHYFKSDDYYLSEKGEWQGKGAEAFPRDSRCSWTRLPWRAVGGEVHWESVNSHYR